MNLNDIYERAAFVHIEERGKHTIMYKEINREHKVFVRRLTKQILLI
jgi:hypothetical protein